MFPRYVLAMIIGCFTGLIGGAFGLGGAVIMLPMIILTGLVKDYKTAVGTVVLTMVAPITILAAIEYYKQKRVDIPVAIILVITAIMTGYLGAKINAYFDEKLLEKCTGFLFVLVGIFFFWKSGQKQ